MQKSTTRLPLQWLLPLTIIVVLWSLGRTPIPEVNHVTPTAAQALLAAGKVLVLDVREREAYAKEHLPNAVAVPIGELQQRLHEFEADKTADVLVYCNEGSSRGPRATDMLNKAGYTRAVNLDGGIQDWRAAGLATIK